MSDYSENRAWSDAFIPDIKKLVGPLLLEVAPMELDVKEATDLMVFCARDMRIAARIRRYGYFAKYGYQFTIRSKLDGGATTELCKIVDGWGDWLFYGHSDEPSEHISQWMLVDLAAFRAGLIRHSMNGFPITYGSKSNGDGTYFTYFDARTFPQRPKLIIASSVPTLENRAA